LHCLQAAFPVGALFSCCGIFLCEVGGGYRGPIIFAGLFGVFKGEADVAIFLQTMLFST